MNVARWVISFADITLLSAPASHCRLCMACLMASRADGKEGGRAGATPCSLSQNQVFWFIPPPRPSAQKTSGFFFRPTLSSFFGFFFLPGSGSQSPAPVIPARR